MRKLAETATVDILLRWSWQHNIDDSSLCSLADLNVRPREPLTSSSLLLSLSFFSFSAACLVATRFAASSCGLSASSLAGIAGVASSSSETISATGQSLSSLSVAASADTSVDREEDASEGEFDDE